MDGVWVCAVIKSCVRMIGAPIGNGVNCLGNVFGSR
jgi:hypothetical protein